MESHEGHVTKDRIRHSGLVERSTIDPVLKTAGAGAEQGLQDHGQSSLSPMHASIEEADGRRDLPTEYGADQDPAKIALHANVTVRNSVSSMMIHSYVNTAVAALGHSPCHTER